MKDFLKVSVSGVRGVVGDSFTSQLAASFAQAFGSFVGLGTVVVGRDTRPTGYMLEQAVVAGLQSVGCKPVLAGIVPTPTVLILTSELHARGGIAITASHNPSQWNALKFVDRSGLFLSPTRAEELYDIYHQGDFRMVCESDIPSVQEYSNPMLVHFNKVLNYVDADVIRGRKFKIAVDCCNGVGALHTRGFLEMLGCEVVACFDAPTGNFEREPEPLPGNLGALSKLVVEHGCAAGFAQDPDGDRLAIVDEMGQPINEDMTVAFAARQVLDHHEKGPVAVHLSTSNSVRHVAEKRGINIIRTKIGEINVSAAMLAAGAVVGGEGNGGVIIPRIHPCRDSYAGMAIVLELMAMENKKVTELCAEMPRYHLVKDKVRIHGEKAAGVLRKLRRKYENRKINLLDGVHVELDDAWFHARMSNTEPVIRLVVEAPAKEQALRLAAELRAEIDALSQEPLPHRC